MDRFTFRINQAQMLRYLEYRNEYPEKFVIPNERKFKKWRNDIRKELRSDANKS